MDLSKIAKQLGKKGGKKSAKARFSGKSKSEISEIMRGVRYSKQDVKELNEMAENSVEALRRATLKK